MVPKITLSVIIPTLNEKPCLSTLLPFLMDNSPAESTEIIVVDASDSCDNVEALCTTLNVRYYRAQQSRRSIQLHFGASQALGKILYFVHADTIPPTTFYNEIIHTLSYNPKLAGCFAYKFDSKKKLLAFNAWFTARKSFYTGGGDQGLFLSSELYTKLGGFDPNVEFMEDFVFYRTITKANIPFTILQSRATVSSRKYDKNSWARVNIVQLFLVMKFYLGTSPSSLQQTYKRWLNPK